MSKQSANPQDRPGRLRVIVRPLPKVIFFYLTWLASLVCAIATTTLTASAPEPSWIGAVWMGAFLFNLLVISFDFNEERSLIFVLLIVVAILALLYAGALSEVGSFLGKLRPDMNDTFYWMVFGAFTVIYLLVWIQSRLNYWIIEPNEIVHRYGLFPKMKRFPTESLRWDKSVPDLLERLLLGSGTIMLTTPSEKFPIVIEHVLRIDTVDDRIAAVLGVKQVVATDGGVESRRKYNDREDE